MHLSMVVVGLVHGLRLADVSFCSPVQKWTPARVRLSFTEEARSILSRSNKPDNNKKKKMVALSQKEGGTLSLTGSVCSLCSVLGEGWLFFFFFFFVLFFFSFLFMFFFLFSFFSFSTDELRSRTGAVVFSPSARQLPPVVN